ncbi:hypothetical protein NLJ89_g4113 [Agrocybe chaxingu]|uniref:D-serine dehydratase n=1 Tax=Agrocybe chaxingu TaxID=84603 RepID=A0A9W8MY64_9AGAR|nr:hypothetical protein NLJ89_g4113 [Agrocybe chaxingu]
MLQTKTPVYLLERHNKDALLSAFSGKPLNALRTPALVVDRKLFAQNCANMHRKAKEWGAQFRAHLKTHKTAEGATLQLVSDEDRTHAVIVSTLMEAWEVVRAGLVANATVKDILYGLPVAPNKIEDLSALRRELDKYGGIVRLLVDHPDQVKFLEEFEAKQGAPTRCRAGLSPASKEFIFLVRAILKSPATSLHGFYGHAGNAYGSTSLPEASLYLSGEVESVNAAAKNALEIISQLDVEPSVTNPFVLSVGSTPTAHAASAETRNALSQVLNGVLELHAGNYPMLDLQQQHTALIDHARISQRVRATVISYYSGRGVGGTDEAMIDAGGIAFSKDTGPSEVFGEVIGRPWVLSRISQEHGILTRSTLTSANEEPLKLGTIVDVIGQHACMIAAAYPWYYVVDPDVDDGKTVVDIWVPWKGW